MKKYKIKSKESSLLNEPIVAYAASDDNTSISVIKQMRSGIGINRFLQLVEDTPFSLKEWSKFLHISERSIERYAKGQKSFEPLQSEKILQITMLYKFGLEVLETKENLDEWFNANILALGNQKPKQFLDTAFGINMVKNVLGRIQHGIFT